MGKNTRAKTVDRLHAYEVRMIDGQPAYALKYYQSQSAPNPYARVKVSWGTDMVGHDMYVQVFQNYELIDNPLAPKPVVVDADPEPVATQLDKNTIFTSARALLDAGISCREVGGRGWAVYWMEGGAELTLFPGGEGPQEMSSIDEVIEAIGGDQECVLTPKSIERFGTLENLQAFLAWHPEPVPQPGYTQLEFTDYIHVTCCQ
jgi:hypothetical protein